MYNKLAELQRQIPNHHMHMNPGDTVQIGAPDFDLDIHGISSPSTYEIPNKSLTQGTTSPTPKATKQRSSVLPLQHLPNKQPCRIQTGRMQSLYKSLH